MSLFTNGQKYVCMIVGKDLLEKSVRKMRDKVK